MTSLIPRMICTVLFLAGAGGVTSQAAWAQATSRDCAAQGAASDRPGPACLLKREVLGDLHGAPVYWRLYTYTTLQAAERDKPARGTVVEAFGQVWLFTIGTLSERPPHGDHQADIGPLATEGGRTYAAEYLKSVFSPGMTAPIHVHSGPEAFYAISGDTCLETPDGVQIARGPGNSLTVRAGPPMLLMALGAEPRRGFALILHDTSLPPTTLVNHWQPKGLCTAH